MVKKIEKERVEFFKNIALMITQLSNEGIDLMPICFYRSPQDQRILYQQGKTKTLSSKHLFWLAIDFVVIKEDRIVWTDCKEYQRAGEIWESLGGIWGGRWRSLNDIYHFEWKQQQK